ncbi:hypothetical protein ABZ128_27415 [Streptomyces sp. NPDC006326]|uniref:hypothetical protein n=1 Tax=Streptomyces sp. NPDC006326 TaxID=3156752 RepID=UPI0033AA327A
MRLYVVVREGDWTAVRHGTYSGRAAWILSDTVRRGFAPERAGEDEPAEREPGGPGGGEPGGDGPAPGLARWRALDRRMHGGIFEISVPDAGLLTVGALKDRCLDEARRRGAAAPEPLAPDPGPRGHSLFGPDRIVDVWLTDAETDDRLPDELLLSGTALADGDLVVLCVEHPPFAMYEMGTAATAEELLGWLPLAQTTAAPDGRPRLWGVLLYTGADAELATYVRTHFDDLNVLSGPATRVFAVERRAGRAAARKYWRRHLEPELYRVLSAVRWLRWTPYDPQGAYEVAATLGIAPERLPCLVFFHALDGPVPEAEKIVFPVEHTSTAYFRSLFGGVSRVLAAVPAEHHESQRAADAAAFAAVRGAEAAIKAAMRPAVPAAANVVVISGAGVSENFYFQGENTTFVNRPQDTVVRDFQNTYSAVSGGDELTRLLQLVLSSRDVPEGDREEAADAIHALARLAAAPEPDAPAAATRLERLRTLLAAGADIAQPALAILTSLAALFPG